MVNICVIEVLEEHMAGKAFGEIMSKGDTKNKLCCQTVDSRLSANRTGKEQRKKRQKLTEHSTSQSQTCKEQTGLEAGLEEREKTHYTDKNKDKNLMSFIALRK